MIQVLLLPSDRTELGSIATAMRTAFDANPSSIPDSFRQEEFAAPNGAHVLYVGCSQQAEGDESEGRSHSYLLQKRAGRVVTINYVTNARTDSDEVHQMIRQSLRVE